MCMLKEKTTGPKWGHCAEAHEPSLDLISDLTAVPLSPQNTILTGLGFSGEAPVR